MNQKVPPDLKDLESRCVQDEPAGCIARCPLHVDVRSFLKMAGSGDWHGAFQALAAAMPLPGIVARICDHPCQRVCKRSEAGGAIAVSEIERIAAKQGRIKKRRIPLPPKKECIAILGNSLSGLTAASELVYKGYRVVILEVGKEPGESLWGFSEDVLPRTVIDEEMDILKRLGVETRQVSSTSDPGWLDAVFADFDAVYAGLGPGGLLEHDGLPNGILPADPVTLATSRPGLFLGGRDTSKTEFPVIEPIADGKRGAISIDRYLQKVSLTAGREKEGPYETKLFTSLTEIASEPQVPMADASGYSETEAMAEAKRCLQCECMECVKNCQYLAHFESYPKRYLRQISTDATMVMGNHGETSKLVNSCSLCGLCANVCPQEISMAEACMAGRKSLADRNKMPPSAHAFALEDMRFTNSEKVALSLHEPEKEQSGYVFFPGCQLAAIYPEHVFSTYAFLRKNLQDVGLMLRCCGVPGKWAVRDDLFEEALHGIQTAWQDLGSPAIIAACPTCYQTLKEHLPQAKMTTLWQVLAETQRPIEANNATGTLAVHDPCATRHEPDIRNAVRKILGLLGWEVEELSLGGDRTECCGFGGLMSAANPPLAIDVAKTRASRSDTDYVTYCAMCRNSLASTGKPALHVLDLLFGDETDPANQKVVGLSERHDNKHSVKKRLLKEVWGKEDVRMDDYEKIRLILSPEVTTLMEERRILTDDVKKVIAHAEKSGMKFFNPDLGLWLASFKPAHVTYWVTYHLENNGFVVHNTYCHRMEVDG